MFYNERDQWHRQRDSRQSILPNMRLPFFAFKTLVNDKHFCSRYFAHIKRATSITPKKFRQFLEDVNSFSDLMHFCKEDAWLWNFIDIRCPVCRTFALRVRIQPDGTWIFVCKNWNVHTETERTFPAKLFQNRIKQFLSKASHGNTRYLSQKGITTPRE